MHKLTIDEISLTPIAPQKSLVGFASCCLNKSIRLDCLAIHTDLLNRSFRIVYPVRRFPNGKEIPIYRPITKEAGDAIQKAIVTEWENIIKSEYF